MSEFPTLAEVLAKRAVIRCATCRHPRADHFEGGACGKRIAPSMRPCTCKKYEEKQ